MPTSGRRRSHRRRRGRGVQRCAAAMCPGSRPAARAVTLLSARTQAISFDPPRPGAYIFGVSFVDAGGNARTATAIDHRHTPATPVSVVARERPGRAGRRQSLGACVARGRERRNADVDARPPGRPSRSTPAIRIASSSRRRPSRRTPRWCSASRARAWARRTATTSWCWSRPRAGAGGIRSATCSATCTCRASTRTRPPGPTPACWSACAFNAQLQYTGAGANTCSARNAAVPAHDGQWQCADGGADHGPGAGVARLDGQELRGPADSPTRPTPTCCGCSTASPRSSSARTCGRASTTR